MFSKFFNKLRCNRTVRAVIFKLNPSHETLTRIRKLAFPDKKINVKKELAYISKMVEDINFKQNLIMDYFINPADAREPSGMLHDVHKILLKIFKDFAEVCEKESIEYWLEYGTLLGAIRHGNIIPWDDDFDVSVEEKDYDRLMAALKRDLTDGYTFSMAGNITKITHSGYTLDIFTYVNNSGRLKPTHLDFDFPHHISPTPREIFLPTQLIDFAGMKARVPADYDSYLRSRFGNYMTLPKRFHPITHLKETDYIVFYPDEKA